MTSSAVDRSTPRRFVLLLVSLTLTLLLLPFTYAWRVNGSRMAPFVFTVLFGTILVTAVLAVDRRRTTRRVLIAMASLTLLLQFLNVAIGSDWIVLAESALGVLLLSYITYVLLRHLFCASEVTGDTIAGSLCVYLLLGFVWAVIYSAVEIFEPGSFRVPTATSRQIDSDGGTEAIERPPKGRHFRFGTASSGTALYFSYVTLTTLGFGDITPATPPARMLTVVEALMGQLYLVTLVARLVGLHIASGATMKSASDQTGSDSPLTNGTN